MVGSRSRGDLTFDRIEPVPSGRPLAAPPLDDVDLGLLRALAGDARTSQRGLARRVGMSPPAIGERIARLERLGVIRGYRADIDYGALGAPLVVVLGIVAVQGSDQRALVDALGALPEVESVDVITGALDLLVRLRVRDHQHLREALFERIWPLPGINRTETSISLASMTPKDFGTQFITALLDERAAARAAEPAAVRGAATNGGGR